MTDRTPTLPGKVMTHTDTLPWVATPRAIAAAARIRTVVETLRRLAEMGEAEIHEALWAIHEEAPDEQIFGAFVERELGIQRDDALRRVAVWGRARRSRPLRELARAGGIGADDVLQRIGRIIDAGAAEVLDDDAEVRKLMVLPGKQLSRALRRLIDQAGQASVPGAPPEPVQAPAPVATIVQAAPALTALTEQILDAERQLAGYPRERLAGLSETDKQRLLRACDSAVAALDNIIDAVTIDRATP